MPRLAARAYPLMEGGAEPSESPSKAERTGYRHRPGTGTGTGGARSRASTDATAQPHRARHATAVGRHETAHQHLHPTDAPSRPNFLSHIRVVRFIFVYSMPPAPRPARRRAAARRPAGGRFVPCSGFRRAPSFWRSFLRLTRKNERRPRRVCGERSHALCAHGPASLGLGAWRALHRKNHIVSVSESAPATTVEPPLAPTD